MKLQRIVSLANKNSEIYFLAMLRSLRLSGCDLPVWVIPYDDNKFDLPDGCVWWEIPQITNWVNNNKLWPAFKKIQCLLIDNYQFIDSDVIFLKNPSTVLENLSGFVTSCTHWNNPQETVNAETLVYFKQKSTTWPKLIFNSGQWACDTQLYNLEELIHFCENNFTDTLFNKNYIYKDQAGINLLVNYKDIAISNLTLPPYNMESTWAGDYLDSNRLDYLERIDEKPYLIHWAGTPVVSNTGIHQYIFKFLTAQEQVVLSKSFRKNRATGLSLKSKIKMIYTILKK